MEGMAVRYGNIYVCFVEARYLTTSLNDYN